MTTYEFEGRIPSVASTAYVDENATIVGDVRVGAQCYIGAGARLRGDYGSIMIGDKTSVQENCVLHARISEECEVGSHVQIGHGAVLHNCRACTATSNFGSAIVGAVFVIFLLNILSFSPVLIGLLGTVGAVGFLLGTLITPIVTKRLGLGMAIAIPAGITVINVATPLAIYGHAFLVVGTIGLITGIMLPIYNINQVSLRQTIVPDRLQGRMNATVRTINWGTVPVGAIIGGTLGATLGIIGTILIGGALQGAAVLWLISKHVIRLKEMPKPDETQGFR